MVLSTGFRPCTKFAEGDCRGLRPELMKNEKPGIHFEQYVS